MEYGMSSSKLINSAAGAAGQIDVRNYPSDEAKGIERSSQIQSASISLEAKIENVQSYIGALEKRLYPILRVTPPTGQEAAKQTVQPVPLAETLQIFGV